MGDLHCYLPYRVHFSSPVQATASYFNPGFFLCPVSFSGSRVVVLNLWDTNPLWANITFIGVNHWPSENHDIYIMVHKQQENNSYEVATKIFLWLEVTTNLRNCTKGSQCRKVEDCWSTPMSPNREWEGQKTHRHTQAGVSFSFSSFSVSWGKFLLSPHCLFTTYASSVCLFSSSFF